MRKREKAREEVRAERTRQSRTDREKRKDVVMFDSRPQCLVPELAEEHFSIFYFNRLREEKQVEQKNSREQERSAVTISNRMCV